MIQSSIVYEGFIGMVENRPLMRCIVTFNYSEMKYFPNVWKSNGLWWTIFRFYNIAAHSIHDYTCEFKCNQVLNLRLALSTQPTAVSSFSSKTISRRANSNDIYIFPASFQIGFKHYVTVLIRSREQHIFNIVLKITFWISTSLYLHVLILFMNKKIIWSPFSSKKKNNKEIMWLTDTCMRTIYIYLVPFFSCLQPLSILKTQFYSSFSIWIFLWKYCVRNSYRFHIFRFSTQFIFKLKAKKKN